MESDSLVLLILLGTTVTLFLSGSLVFFVVFYQKRMLQKKMEAQALESDYQRKLLQTTIDSQEKERKRIASELHDGAGALLSAAKLNLGMITSGVIKPNETAATVRDTKDMLDDTIDTIRRVSKDLLPSSLEQFGLLNAIEELANKLNTASHNIEVIHKGSSVTHLNTNEELLVYRVIQELLNNAIKHAEASEILVSLTFGEINELQVKDNGKGFNLSQIKGDIKKGVGIYNIENRVSILNGNVDIDSEKGKGTTITITFGGK